MKIRFLKDYKHGVMSFEAGDQFSSGNALLSDDEALALVQHGFAEDVDGNVPTGEHTPGVKNLVPNDVTVTGGATNG